jgi:hypothetical protein
VPNSPSRSNQREHRSEDEVRGFKKIREILEKLAQFEAEEGRPTDRLAMQAELLGSIKRDNMEHSLAACMVIIQKPHQQAVARI